MYGRHGVSRLCFHGSVCGGGSGLVGGSFDGVERPLARSL